MAAGREHALAEPTPNSKNANAIFDRALATNDLHRIGVAAHGYVDTWAHQNFTGYYGDFNSVEIAFGAITPNIGHADAGHNPDWPALVWTDPRLIQHAVDNRARFLEAAVHLLAKLAVFADKRIKPAEIKKRQREVRRDLDAAIGARDQSNDFKAERVIRYRELAATAPYQDAPLSEYDEHVWFEEAVNEDVRGLQDRSDNKLLRFDPFNDVYTWKNSRRHRETDWYKFQEAVKTHQGETWEILESTNLQGLELEAL